MITTANIIQVLTKATHRLDGQFFTVSDVTNYQARIRLPDRLFVGMGLSPVESIRNLFEQTLKAGILTTSDFEDYKRLLIFRANESSTPETIKWLRLFTSTEYQRVAFPNDCEVNPPSGIEFVIAYKGSRRNAPEVIKRVSNERI